MISDGELTAQQLFGTGDATVAAPSAGTTAGDLLMSQLNPLDFDYERFPGIALRATDQKLPGHALTDRLEQLGELGRRIAILIFHVTKLLGTPPWRDTLGNQPEVQERMQALNATADALVALQPADSRAPMAELRAQEQAELVRSGFNGLLNLLLFLMDEWGSPTGLEWYRNLFDTSPIPTTIPPPQAVEDFLDPAKRNQIFASWWVQGNNPLCVRGVTLAEIEHEVGTLDANKYALVMPNDTPGAADHDNRLFWVDFPTLLAGLEPGDYPVNKRLPKPRVLFAVKPGCPAYEPFVPLAIFDDSTNQLVWSDVASPGTANDWTRAMLASLCANQLHHTWVSHFPRTHFVMEAVAVATLRTLETPQHPIFWLLRAHIDGTLGFNETALGAFTDQSGADRFLMASTLRTGQKLMLESLNGWQNYDFMEDLKQRQVRREQLPYYPYRDDAKLWWDAIESMVHGVVDAAYTDDAAVRNDARLQAWADVLVAKRKMPENGAELIPKAPTTKAELQALLQKILFTCTAYHAAVQIPLNGFDVSPLTAPCSLYPDKSTDPPEAMLANLGTSLFQLAFFYFGDIVTFSMGDYQVRSMKGPMPIPTKMKDEVKTFKKALRGIERDIDAANQLRKVGAYKTLLPEMVSRSVDI